MQSNVEQYYPSSYTFYVSHFSWVRHLSHPGQGHGSLTCHMTQFEWSDCLGSENFINIMIEWYTKDIIETNSDFFQLGRIDLSDNPLICDCRLAWLKQCPTTEVIMTSTPCDSPQPLVEVPWMEITIDMLCQGKRHVKATYWKPYYEFNHQRYIQHNHWLHMQTKLPMLFLSEFLCRWF